MQRSRVVVPKECGMKIGTLEMKIARVEDFQVRVIRESYD